MDFYEYAATSMAHLLTQYAYDYAQKKSAEALQM